MLEHSRSLPNDCRTDKNDKSSPEASSSNNVEKLRAHHMIASGQHPDKWQAGTAKASTSGLDGQSTRQIEDCSSECKEISVLSNAWDKGKYQLSPEEERWLMELLRSIPIGENGQRVPRVDLATTFTPDHLILVGGMKKFTKWLKGGTSHAKDHKFHHLADIHYAQDQYKLAEAMYKYILADYEGQMLSPDDSRIERVRKNLASIAEKFGQPLENYVGQQFGDYRLVKLLGKGGFGEVYLGECHLSGEHTDGPTRVAIKVLLNEHLKKPEEVNQFRKEAGILAGLRHPHIVQVRGFDVKSGVPYLVMECVEGGTLRQAHPRGTCLSLEQVLTYMKQTASALQHVHERKLMHLDLKPENLLLGAEGKVLLSDFGLVRDVHNTTSRRTQEQGGARGTYPYMAPAYMLGGPPSPKCDQYALAAMVYEWVSGKLPFQGLDIQIYSRHEQGYDPEPLHESIPNLSHEIEAALFRALEKNPEERFVDVKRFTEIFEQACRSSEQEEQAPQEHNWERLGYRLDDETWLASKDGKAFPNKHLHDFIETSAGKSWSDAHLEEWIKDKDEYMEYNAHKLLETEPGKAWFEKHGKEWMNSETGKIFMSWHAHKFLETEPGSAWFDQHGNEWIESYAGKKYMSRYMHLLIRTESGKVWAENGGLAAWIQSASCKQYRRRNVHRLLETEPGKDWFGEYGRKWIKGSDGKFDGQIYMMDFAHLLIGTEVGKNWFNKYGIKWLNSYIGEAFMEKKGVEFLNTEVGKEWLFGPHGESWLGSDAGQAFMEKKGDEFLNTEVGKERLFGPHGESWLGSDAGKSFMKEKGVEFLNTEVGKEWAEKGGLEGWLQSHSGKEYMAWHAHELLETEAGKAWAEKGGLEVWLRSDSGKKYMERYAYKLTKVLGYRPDDETWLASEDGGAFLKEHIHRVCGDSFWKEVV